MIEQLLERPAWIFDMDGTLTLAVHDFDAIREELGLRPGQAILEQLEHMKGEPRLRIEERLAAIELEIARDSTAAEGAHELLTHLRGHARLGILTRNTRANALVTLAAAGLEGYFDPEHVLGREEAPPKPDPRGLQHLLRAWGHGPDEAVMVGDFRFDLEAGRAAGAAVVYCDPSAMFPFADLADHCVARLMDLLPEA